jgi:hypothetical protein
MLLIQLFTVVVAIALAWANKIPCRKMIDYGASLNEEKEFHRANAVVKILFAAVCAYSVHSLLMFLLLLLILWLIFDIALNLFLKKDWHYTGDTAKSDKLLRRAFGEETAGLWKMLFVSSAILIINFFL